MESRVGRSGSSTSTALRAEYEYEYGLAGRRSEVGQPGAIGCNAFGVGEGVGGNAGPFVLDVRRGVLVLVLVLEPMGTWNGVEGWAWWFEYEYRPSG